MKEGSGKFDEGLLNSLLKRSWLNLVKYLKIEVLI